MLHSLPRLDTDGEYKSKPFRRESIAGESVKDDELNTSESEVQYPKKTEEARKSILEKISNNLLFRSLDRKQKDSVNPLLVLTPCAALEE